ncbi:LamG domain-containing protein [Hufsiella ginkgonis]|uniref:LamG domain-containing protein n=1 Tax=Hufsiella ginkgonis TaxID=2695274 RepID=A0A7K1XU30_9SPHI|nr:LamG domain-containing protein [Hufsiella ginkgonis]MXV14515.1 hypothetical protein [Hufsiella ginkgonis]
MRKILLLLLAIAVAVSGCEESATTDQPSTDGLVGWWPFDNNSNDLSGKTNHAVLRNGTAYAPDRNGLSTGAVILDGVDDYVSFPSGSSSSLNITGDFTVCFWVKTIDNSAGLVSFGDNVSNAPLAAGYLSALNGGNVGNGKLGIGLRGSWNTHPPVIADDKWHFIAYVLRDNRMGIYMDNFYGWEFPAIQPPLSWNGNRVVGCRNDLIMGDTWNYKGAFDDLRVYNRALTSGEVLALAK